MKRFIIPSVVLAAVISSAVPALARVSTNVPPALSAKFSAEEDQFSYAVGVMVAADMRRNFGRAGIDPKFNLVVEGFTASMMTNSPLLSDTQAQGFFREYRAAQTERASAKNKADGLAYLEANKTKEGVVTLPSGLQYKIITVGEGPKPTATDTVNCHYRGTLVDGTEFDSSYGRGEPAGFSVTGVIKGWTEALQMMPVGSKWQLTIPSELAYGVAGRPKIGPNSTLLFDIELISIKEASKPAATPAAGQIGGAQPVVTSDIIKVPSKAEMDKGAKIEVIKAADVERLQQEAAKKAGDAAKDSLPKK